jgi:hypothetical protein
MKQLHFDLYIVVSKSKLKVGSGAGVWKEIEGSQQFPRFVLVRLVCI